MQPARHFTARTLIWLAAIATPVQGWPAAACGCGCDSLLVPVASDVATAPGCCSGVLSEAHPTKRSCPCTGARVCRCSEKKSCCQPKSACCGSSAFGVSGCCGEANSCCSSGSEKSGCSCGDDCQCGKSEPTKQHPATPPAEGSQVERVIANLAASVPLGSLAAILPEPSRFDTTALAASLPAVDRCVSLCCFRI